jgi:hypothetical protein
MAAGTFNPTLADDDFRGRRVYLPAEAFALVTGPYEAPTDPMSRKQWQELMSLPTDVLLRTSDHHGSQLAQLNTLWSGWMGLLPVEPQVAPFIFNVGWDAADDFNVSTFNAAHDYYRQGIANLRSALEGLTLAASFAKRQNEAGLRDWLSGQREPPKFGNARDILAPELGADITAVLKDLHKELSGYIHSGPGGSNGVLWNGSNGPIWVSESFGLVYRCFRDVMAMCLVMLSIGWPGFVLPRRVEPLFDTPGSVWTLAAQAAVNAGR